jgi:putative flippase GtrA
VREYGTVVGNPSRNPLPVVIPAYKPGAALPELISELRARGYGAIVVVNDGSGPEFDGCFKAIASQEGICLAEHAVNLGKGAALKTGMNLALVRFPNCIGAVTADADGQHSPDDVVKVGEQLRCNRESMVLGARTFDEKVPWKSRIGNNVTRQLMRVIAGQKISDTQTGLRGIPASLMRGLLRLPSSGYEFELDMLMACKQQGFEVLEVPIRTIYLDHNRGSHFHPLFDSMKIYFLLLRFSTLSLLTAILDNLVFALAYAATGSIGKSQLAGRLVATVFNYLTARRVVFQSRQKHALVLPKYLSLVVANGLISYMLIQFLHYRAGIGTLPAKLMAEGLLFVASFAIQRDFVFTSPKRQAAKAAQD